MQNILKIRVDRHRSVQNTGNVLLDDFVVWRKYRIRSLLNDAGLAQGVRIQGTEQNLSPRKRAVYHRATKTILQLHRLKHLDAKTLYTVMLAVATVVVHRVNDLLPPAEPAKLAVHEALAIAFIDDGMADLTIEFFVENVAHQDHLGTCAEGDVVRAKLLLEELPVVLNA